MLQSSLRSLLALSTTAVNEGEIEIERAREREKKT